MKPCRLLLLLLTLLSFQARVQGQDYRWKPGTVKAVVKPNDALKIGQYLFITHESGRPENDDSNKYWNMAKIDLPEKWTVKEIKISDAVILVLTDVGSFSITPENLKPLFYAMPEHDQRSEELLQRIWMEKAGFKAVPANP